ncbi:hypothetical protein O181_046500 [Austropuccinia psidii MF-1]|uniref:Uncharacterized protein n=1 Tax=Austropuccinia psidii MF-1 TaxID=1389203 RepID=A0A9Q3HM93_9BASI|nr:hypothetical protein [Austropuccinia psidii MF-1]
MKRFLGQKKIIEILRGWSLVFHKDKVKKRNNWLKNQSCLSIEQKKALEMSPAVEKEGPVASTSSRAFQRQSKGPQKGQRGPNRNKGNGKIKYNWHRTYPQGYRITKMEPSAMGCVHYGQKPYGFHSQEQERIKRTFLSK